MFRELAPPRPAPNKEPRRYWVATQEDYRKQQPHGSSDPDGQSASGDVPPQTPAAKEEAGRLQARADLARRASLLQATQVATRHSSQLLPRKGSACTFQHQTLHLYAGCEELCCGCFCQSSVCSPLAHANPPWACLQVNVLAAARHSPASLTEGGNHKPSRTATSPRKRTHNNRGATGIAPAPHRHHYVAQSQQSSAGFMPLPSFNLPAQAEQPQSYHSMRAAVNAHLHQQQRAAPAGLAQQVVLHLLLGATICTLHVMCGP